MVVVDAGDENTPRVSCERARPGGPDPGRHGPTRGRVELDLLAELATAARLARPPDAVGLACRRLAEILDADRCSLVVELEGELAVLASSERPTAGTGSEPEGGSRVRRVPVRPLGALVEQVMREGRPRRVEWPLPGSTGPFPSGRGASAAGLAVPVGELGALVVESQPGWECDSEDVRLAYLVAALLGDLTRSVCREREQVDHDASADALRQLLEMGVRA